MDEFFFTLIFTSILAAKTVPVALAEFVGRYVTDINAMMAGEIVAAIPPVLLALLFHLSLYCQRPGSRGGKGITKKTARHECNIVLFAG